MQFYFRLFHRIRGVPVLRVPRTWPEALRRVPPPDEHQYDNEWRRGWRPAVIERVDYQTRL